TGAVIGHFGVLVPLGLFGVIVTWTVRPRPWILYAMMLAYAASVVLFYVFARYRYPLVPFLILFAAAGMAALPELTRARSIPRRTTPPRPCWPPGTSPSRPSTISGGPWRRSRHRPTCTTTSGLRS